MSTPALNAVTLRQLEYVVAVADQLGFRKAAEQLHVSQPSLSAQVQHVEDVLGVRLFERGGRRVLLTDAGREVVARARRVLDEARQLLEAAGRLADPFAGVLRLGVIPTVAPYALPDVVPALAAQYPKLELHIREEVTASLVHALADGSLDAALLALTPEVQGLAHAPLAEDPFLLALPAGHPLARRKRVRLADLEAQRVLLLDDGHCFRSQALAVCGRSGAREAGFRGTSLTTLAQMVTSGAGVTLLPALAVPTECRSGRLVARPFEAPVPGRSLVLAWRPGSSREATLRHVAATLREAWPRPVRAAG